MVLFGLLTDKNKIFSKVINNIFHVEAYARVLGLLFAMHCNLYFYSHSHSLHWPPVR